jgi:hypothetical protein
MPSTKDEAADGRPVVRLPEVLCLLAEAPLAAAGPPTDADNAIADAALTAAVEAFVAGLPPGLYSRLEAAVDCAGGVVGALKLMCLDDSDAADFGLAGFRFERENWETRPAALPVEFLVRLPAGVDPAGLDIAIHDYGTLAVVDADGAPVDAEIVSHSTFPGRPA